MRGLPSVFAKDTHTAGKGQPPPARTPALKGFKRDRPRAVQLGWHRAEILLRPLYKGDVGVFCFF